MSQFNSPNYEVPRTSGVCAFNGRTLEPGEVYYATLVDCDPQSPEGTSASAAGQNADTAPAESTAETPASESRLASALGLLRVDVSPEAWEQGHRPPRMFSYWRSTVPQPSEKRKLFVDDTVLMNLFRRLDGANEPQRLAFRYVLTLILMRKKLLRFDAAEVRHAEVDGQPVEQEWWTLTPKLDLSKGPMGKWNEDDKLELLDPQLDESQVAQVTEQLGEILEAEL